MDYLNMTDQDLTYLWEEVNSQRQLFHPIIAPDGRIVFDEFFQHRTELAIILDNNILVDLICLYRNGCLKDIKRMREIASLMLWIAVNGVHVSAGQALQEKAATFNSTDLSQDYSDFTNIFDVIPLQQWQSLRCGQIDRLPVITRNCSNTCDMSIYTDTPEVYYHAYASVLKLVSLLRESKLERFQRVKAFIEWAYNNTVIAKYSMVYALLLITDKGKGIKAPKRAFSSNISEVLKGCKNQAWDLANVTIWSQMLDMKENRFIPEMFLFATRDETLKQIILTTIGSNDIAPIFQSIFTSKEYSEICDLISALQTQDRKNRLNSLMKPEYLQSLALLEEKNLRNIIRA